MVPEAELDEHVVGLVLDFLADPQQYRRLDHGKATGVELRAARAERDDIQRHYDEMETELRARRMSPAAFARAEPGVLGDLEKAKARVRLLETPSRLHGLITPGPDVATRWAAIDDVAVYRKILGIVLSPEGLGVLRIFRSPKPGVRVPVEQRVGYEQSER